MQFQIEASSPHPLSPIIISKPRVHPVDKIKCVACGNFCRLWKLCGQNPVSQFGSALEVFQQSLMVILIIVSRYEVRIEYRGSIGNVATQALLRKFSKLKFGIAEET